MEQRKDLGKFFKLAVSNCCNYAAHFNHKRHACMINSVCLLNDNEYCQYFADNILGYGPFKHLIDEWDLIFPFPGFKAKPEKEIVVEVAELSEPYKHIIPKVCIQCTKKFKPTSNRQTRCSVCSKENRKKLVSKAVRKHKKSRDKTGHG
jgi:hypothetical protein